MGHSEDDVVHKIPHKISICEFWGYIQGWIKCGSGEHRSQEMTRKIEEIVTLGYEEKREEEETEEEGKIKRRKEKKEEREEEEKEKRRVEIEELIEGGEEHGDDELKSSKANEWTGLTLKQQKWGRMWRKKTKKKTEE